MVRREGGGGYTILPSSVQSLLQGTRVRSVEHGRHIAVYARHVYGALRAGCIVLIIVSGTTLSMKPLGIRRIPELEFWGDAHHNIHTPIPWHLPDSRLQQKAGAIFILQEHSFQILFI